MNLRIGYLLLPSGPSLTPHALNSIPKTPFPLPWALTTEWSLLYPERFPLPKNTVIAVGY